jgi:hypothetical protein
MAAPVSFFQLKHDSSFHLFTDCSKIELVLYRYRTPWYNRKSIIDLTISDLMKLHSYCPSQGINHASGEHIGT